MFLNQDDSIREDVGPAPDDFIQERTPSQRLTFREKINSYPTERVVCLFFSL